MRLLHIYRYICTHISCTHDLRSFKCSAITAAGEGQQPIWQLASKLASNHTAYYSLETLGGLIVAFQRSMGYLDMYRVFKHYICLQEAVGSVVPSRCPF